MTSWRLLLCSLRHYWRTRAAVAAGTALATAVLVGALAAGDSLRYSLRRLADCRLGTIQAVLAGGERNFRASLADALAGRAAVTVVPALQLRGSAALPDGSRRAAHVQVLGVTPGFGTLAATPVQFPVAGRDDVVLNQALTRRLGIGVGEQLILRVEKPVAWPAGMPLTPADSTTLALRVTVRGIVPDEQLGRFSLQSRPGAVLNAFVSLPWLAEKVGLPGRANLLLAGSGHMSDRAPDGMPENGVVTVERLAGALAAEWQLADAGLEVRELPATGELELRSSRIFLEPAIGRAALSAAPGACGVFTYFVNSLEANQRAVPYSFVAAGGAALLPAGMPDDGMVVNAWLAAELGIEPGDPLTLRYFVLGPDGRLQEDATSLRVDAVVPLAGAAADPSLMPEFPGLAAADNCRDWKPGIPIDLNRIRPQDEQYWQECRGTPKAFVTLPLAQRLWQNRFGTLTAVRYPAGTDAGTVAAAICRLLKPDEVGLRLTAIADPAREGQATVDFSGLFIGLSCFVILAALLLTGLLFSFDVEQRLTETGTLLALGYSRALVRRLTLAEGAAVVACGAAVGVAGGYFYHRLILLGLRTVWKGAVGGELPLIGRVAVTAPVFGAVAAAGAALAGMWLVVRAQAYRPVHTLQAGAGGENVPQTGGRRFTGVWAVAVLATLGAIGTVAVTGTNRGPAAVAAFFAAGSLALVAGLAFARLAMAHAGPALHRLQRHMTLTALAWSGIVRRPRRSLAAIGFLACGVFLVIAVSANRQGFLANPRQRDSGTGGFLLVAECAVPVARDLNAADVRRSFGLDPTVLAGTSFVGLVVRDGDDASCLNVNRVQTPQLLGVPTAELDRRGAFAFAEFATGVDRHHPWAALEQDTADDTVPGFVDQAVLQWGLRKTLGDTLEFSDEAGRRFRVRLVGTLANSLFQGSVLVSDRVFQARFPGIGGRRLFLVDGPPARMAAVARQLSTGLADRGLEVQPAAERLAQFNQVQNSYLAIFFLLGSLGVIVGVAGLGILLLRNVLERRGELGLLRAVGFSAAQVRRLLVVEHALLLAGGLVCGALAAAVAVIPAVTAAADNLPWSGIAAALGAILLNGLFWITLCAWLGTRTDPLVALRDE